MGLPNARLLFENIGPKDEWCCTAWSLLRQGNFWQESTEKRTAESSRRPSPLPGYQETVVYPPHILPAEDLTNTNVGPLLWHSLEKSVAFHPSLVALNSNWTLDLIVKLGTIDFTNSFCWWLRSKIDSLKCVKAEGHNPGYETFWETWKLGEPKLKSYAWLAFWRAYYYCWSELIPD